MNHSKRGKSVIENLTENENYLKGKHFTLE